MSRSSLTAEHFNKIREQLAARRRKEGEDKQVSYTRGSDNRLANFDNIADRSAGALTPGTVLYVYMSKHFDALSAFLLKGIQPSESLEDVVGDLMNYAELALGMYVRDMADAPKTLGTPGVLQAVMKTWNAGLVDAADRCAAELKSDKDDPLRLQIIHQMRELEKALDFEPLRDSIIEAYTTKYLEQRVEELRTKLINGW